MSSARTTRCLEHLQFSEELCALADLLTWDCMATQSAIAMELAAWHELIDDMDRLESRLTELAAQLVRLAEPPEQALLAARPD